MLKVPLFGPQYHVISDAVESTGVPSAFVVAFADDGTFAATPNACAHSS